MLISRHASLRALLLGAIGCQSAVSDDPSCQDPKPVLLANGQPSGYQRCADGATNRVASATFAAVNTDPACLGTEMELACSTDANCTKGPNGRCIHHEYGYASCSCEYTCATDADCGAGMACVPQEVSGGATHPVCAPAACKTGPDCASGECGLIDADNGCAYVTELRCRDTDTDKCHGDNDCAEVGAQFTCDSASIGQAFSCVTRSCVIGRPLLVGGTARVAPTVRRADWIAGLA